MSTEGLLSLSLSQKRRIRESFESVREYSDSVVLLFYGRFFELAPEVRPLFKTDIREQAVKLMDTLALLVDALDHFETLRPQLAELGRRHASYRVEPDHYRLLSTALLWAFGQALGIEFDRETGSAWKLLLSDVSDAMLANAVVVAPVAGQE